MSPTPSAPRREGANDPGQAPGQPMPAVTGGPAAGPRGRSPEPAGRRARRWALRSVLLGAVVLATAGCQSTTFTRLGLPAPVTKQGDVVVTLWRGSWIAAFCVGATVWGLILWAVIFHRKRSDRPPRQVRYNLPIEIMYTVVPFIMVGVFFFFTARDENYINQTSPHPDLTVTVYGYQWSWEFQYPGYKVTGKNAVVTEQGAPWPGRLPTLVIPENETVHFDLVSLDVVHSFWVPPFEFKRDLIPGHPNHFQITANKTGTYLGHCTEFCGLYHSRMLFWVKIVTPAQFRAWITAQQHAQTSAGSA